jgi:tetratricopeptide (TPR) repeat protein
MKKTTLTLFSVVLATSLTVAQSLDEGIKFLYYERTKSAVETLEKVVASNSKDPKSIYWLGQAYLAADDKAKAKALYQKALTDGVNDPWIWVGTGHVELLDGGDKNAARQRFDQAITTATPTKGKNKGNPDTDILNAVGRANADGSSQQGDPLYGIEKLKKAAELNLTDPDIDINLGKSYLKLGSDGGGQAVEAFTDATRRNPQYAAAYYRIGRIYQSQNNLEYMNEWYGKAIAADPAYGPVFLAYFNYYKERDVNAAKEYLDKYVANADKDCEVDYFVADYLYRAGKNQESIAKAKEMESGACKDYPRVNVIYAYNYDKLGDSVQAKSYVDKFFATASADKIESTDYVFAAKLYTKFPGSEAKAIEMVNKAVDADTSMDNKKKYLTIGGDMLSKAKMYPEQLAMLLKLKQIKGSPLTGTEYYYVTKAAIDAKDCAAADTLSKQYVSNYPDLAQGYSFGVTTAKMCDVDTTKGLAVEPINAYNTFLMKDVEKNRKTIFNNNYYLLVYYAQYAKQIDSAIAVTDQMKALYTDPASEEYKFADETGKKLQGALQKKSNGSNGSSTKSTGTTGKSQ